MRLRPLAIILLLCSSALAQSNPGGWTDPTPAPAMIPPAMLYVCRAKPAAPCAIYKIKVTPFPIGPGALMGETNFTKKEILLYRHPDNFLYAATLLHEGMHAVLWESYYRDFDHEKMT